MTGAARPRRGGGPRQPRSRDPVGPIPCPSCGLRNDPGARVCRNCGLPVASASDPLRGVTPGRLDVPGVRSSGISATFGLVVVIAVLLVAGAVVVSGDGLLSRGGFIGFGGPAESPQGTPAPGATGAPGASVVPASTREPTDPTDAETAFSCESASIRDPERSRWRLTGLEAAAGDGFEQIGIALSRAGRNASSGTVRTEWLSPEEAVLRYEIPRPAGTRALALRFEGTVELGEDRALDAAALDGLGVRNVRSIQVSSGPDGKTVAVVGIAGEGCARLSSPRWQRRGADRSAEVLLDIEAP